MTTWDNYERVLLALAAWREARGEPYAGQLAVCFTILNRVGDHNWMGNTIAEVIAKKWQFSSMTAPGDPNLIHYPVREDPSFIACLGGADAAIDKLVADPVAGADSYFDVSIPAPKWATPNKFVAQIGRFKFYKLNQDWETMMP